jgi:hypothetical protein
MNLLTIFLFHPKKKEPDKNDPNKSIDFSYRLIATFSVGESLS